MTTQLFLQFSNKITEQAESKKKKMKWMETSWRGEIHTLSSRNKALIRERTE